MSAGQLERRRSMSSGAHSTSAALMPSPPLDINDELEPSAATASLFLFAQGSTILSLHHDTLAVDRKFESHEGNILFIAVDNVSERGAGRLVVSYDTSQTAIIWDLFTGQEIARFASFDLIRVASWMRNGNISFGTVKGDIILFEPSTSEHVSARTIFDPITALAPAADCRSYAIGYRNGSMLIATLQPFTILHTLTTSRGPSPIVSMAWHASSTKQKSDMLATLTVDGDLLVWSVSKPPGQDAPRVIRTLRRSESSATTPKWLAWSKNGRIIHYSDSETWAWDVRTKHVTYERIPTIQGVRGMANYGPTASLFTLGPNNTVQQYDLLNPAMVANVQHTPNTQKQTAPEGLHTSLPLQAALASASANQAHRTIAELKGVTASPPQRSPPTFEVTDANRADRTGLRSPEPLTAHSLSRSRNHHQSRGSRSLYSGATTTTSFSTSSPVQSGAESIYSMRYASSASVTSGGSLRGPSRLRNEYVPSGNPEPISELFPYTRSRLNDVPFRPPQRVDEDNTHPDELRKQMLSVVFGWEGDITDLLNDELRRHSPGGQHAVILGRWLGHVDFDCLLGMSTSASSRYTGWMLLALSTLNSQHETKKMGHALVQKLLARGDIHAAVAILIGMGDGNDGIEIYVSRNMYMEAILLTCLLMPMEWSRQAYLVRRWGEYVVQNSQQHLAIRCFSCTETNDTEVWPTPSVQITNILSSQLSNKSSAPPSVIIPPTNPNPSNLLPSSARPLGKNQALKLITSFGPDATSYKFPGLQSADRTPTNLPGVTPIESAMGDSIMSPGSFTSHRQKLGRQVLSARAITPGGHQTRLPSIGETPTDVNPPSLAVPKSLPTPDNSGSEREVKTEAVQVQPPNQDQQLVFLTSARYTPHNDPEESGKTALVLHEDTNTASAVRPTSKTGSLPGDFLLSTRNGSRDRKPEGLQIQWPPVYSARETAPSSGGSLPSHLRYPSQKDASGYSVDSPTCTRDGANSLPAESISGRSVSDYINSLDAASYYSQKYRSEEDSTYSSKSKRSKESRGRSKQRYIQPAKRSPSSPVPMSPDDFALYSLNGSEQPSNLKVKEPRKNRSRSGNSRRRPSRTRGPSHPRASSRGGDNPERIVTDSRQARSRPRQNSFGIRSPSSPIPMSPSERDQALEDNLRFVSADRNQRLQSRDRSSARRTERGTSTRRDSSPDRKRPGSRSRSRQPKEQQVVSPVVEINQAIQHYEPTQAPGLTPIGAPIFDNIQWHTNPADEQKMREIERMKKEQAAAELEARRLSLARRPSAPVIPLPGEAGTPNSTTGRSHRQSGGSPPTTNGSFSQRVMGWPHGSPAYSVHSDSSTGQRSLAPVPVGLPATPRAMRHPKYSSGYTDVPPVPDIRGYDCGLSPVSMTDQTRSLSIARSMSAPIPEDTTDGPVDGIPAHPHFRPRLPSSRSGRISMHRKDLSHDGNLLNGSQPGSFSGQSGRKASEAIIVPPVLPELQHLNAPPPPPPPPPPSDGMDGNGSVASSLQASGEERNSLISGVGTINIAIDEPTVLNANELSSQQHHQHQHHQQPQQQLFPPMTTTEFPAPPIRRASSAQGSILEHHTHRRGRSINDNLANKIRSLTGRMRSTSRGRNVRTPPSTADGEMMPYESVPSMTSMMAGGGGNGGERGNRGEF